VLQVDAFTTERYSAHQITGKLMNCINLRPTYMCAVISDATGGKARVA
jgi:hypothetical protein